MSVTSVIIFITSQWEIMLPSVVYRPVLDKVTGNQNIQISQKLDVVKI